MAAIIATESVWHQRAINDSIEDLREGLEQILDKFRDKIGINPSPNHDFDASIEQVIREYDAEDQSVSHQKVIQIARDLFSEFNENREEMSPETLAIVGTLALNEQVVEQSIEPSQELFSEYIRPLISDDFLLEMCCFDYAFLKTGDVRSLQVNDYEDLKTNLKDWGYTQVKDPLPGDLVLFSAHDSCRHLGIFMGEGMVQSKWGATPFIYNHSLEAAPRSYGETIGYFRPPSREFLEDLAKQIY